MSAARWSLRWGQLLSLLLSVLSYVIAEDCIIPKAFPHFITVDMQEVDTHMCYKCYGAPTKQGFQVILNELRLNGYGSVMMYVDGTPRRFTEDCGECETENFIEVDEDGGLNTKADVQCHECDAVPNGTLVELYVRLSPHVQAPSGNKNLCQSLPSIIPNFNISLTINTNKQDIEASPDCDDGFSVNFPLSGDTCVVNSTFLGGETDCVVPTCSDGIISADVSNDKIEHKFLPSNSPETCVWRLDLEQRKHLTLQFSKNIRPHLTVFEETLSNPKWDILWCLSSFSNEFTFQTDAASVFVVYRNNQKLTKKGKFSLSAQADLCLLPPKLENGNVEFRHIKSGTVAYYSCDKGFTLLGPTELRCKSRAWDKPPICLPVDEPATVLYDMEDNSYENEEDDYEDEKEMKEFEHTAIMEAEEEIIHSNRTELENIDDDERDKPAANTNSSGEVLVVVDGNSNKAFDLLQELLNLTMDDDMTLYLIVGAVGLVVIIIISIISIIVYRKKYPVRLGLGRKFDTFQNPIYEKTVVQMPMQIEETEVGRKKSDAEDLSDCTVLE